MERRVREPRVRDWPALMDLTTAGEYLALSPGSLLALLRREQVSPVELGGRLRRWRRDDLDALIDRLPMGWSSTGTAEAAAAEDVDGALEAVERRRVQQRRRRTQGSPHEIRQSHPPT